MLRKIFAFSILLVCFLVSAQQDSIPTIQLDSIVVEAARLTTEKGVLPASVTIKPVTAIQQNLQQLSVSEYLQAVPGLFIQSNTNFAQDSRISIRGFGARSAFGIRGIKLIIDGIPETTPDGQGQVDNLNLALIENIEILRGGSSSLYGNASGGVINVSTLSKFTNDFVELSSVIGSYNYQKYLLKAGIKNKKSTTTLFANRTSLNGYRNHSSFLTNQFNLRSNFELNSISSINIQLNYTDSPYAEDPGGITQEDVSADRTQARDRNETFDAGEAVRQFKTGIAFRRNNDKSRFNSFVYYANRDFENRLPFEANGSGNLVRNYWGHGSNISFILVKPKANVQLQFGYEFANQNDRRSRFDNIMGERGDLTAIQNEVFRNFGTFAILQSRWESLVLRTGIRFDSNTLKIEDAFLTDGNASDTRILNTLNPSLGLRYKISPFSSIFATYSTSFETPVLSELSANPDNEGGFNQNLKEQTSRNYELGYAIGKNKLSVETAFFYIATQGDIIPFELEAFPGRTFFRNSGQTQRYGFELASSLKVSKSLDLNATYTWSRFTYEKYALPNGNFDGNRLPGIPEHLLFLQANYALNKNLVIRLNTQYRGSFFANDANAVTEESAVILNLNASKTFDLRTFKLIPLAGINNLTNSRYSDNVRINAFGGRYFEPAPQINGYVGLRLLMD